MSAKGVLRIIEGGRFGFWCPGCRSLHVVDSGWVFNGDFSKPTFNPSVLVAGGHYADGFKTGDKCWCTYNVEHPDAPGNFKCMRCHSFVRNGMIQFLSDCTHELAGKTIPMEEP